MGARGRGREWLVLGLSCALCLGALEVSFRRVLPMAPLDGGAVRDPEAIVYAETAYARNAIAPLPHVVKRGARDFYRINDKGYRGGDFGWEKPDGAVRIAVYGGSAVFDIFEPVGEHWPARLGRVLAADGHSEVEVINAGIPGHTVPDSLGRFLAEGHRLRPDFVLLYHGWNDIKYFRREAPLLRSVQPYRIGRDPSRTPRGRLDAGLARGSHLYRFLRLRFLAWNEGFGLEGRPQPGEMRDAIVPAQVEQYALAVSTFVDLVRNAGATPVLVLQARLVAPDNDEDARARIHYDAAKLGHAALVEAFAATDRVLRRIAAEKSALLIDATASLNGDVRFFADHVHLSETGSAEVARLVAEALAPLLGAPAGARAGAATGKQRS